MEKRIYVRVGLGGAALAGFVAGIFLSRVGLVLMHHAALLREFRFTVEMVGYFSAIFVSVVSMTAFILSSLSKAAPGPILRMSVISTLIMTASFPPYFLLAVKNLIGGGAGASENVGFVIYLPVLIFGWRWVLRRPPWRQCMDDWRGGRKLTYYFLTIFYVIFVSWVFLFFMFTYGK